MSTHLAAYPQHRPVTLACRGLVAAPHYLAAQAGLDMLKAGGNAVDAAIAANATLQVVYPFVVGLGGDLFALGYDARSGHMYGLNGSGRSAQAATIERYAALGHTTMPRYGLHSVTVPGCADGWGKLMERSGRLGLERALASAIGYAEEGFPVGPDLHAALVRMSAQPHTHSSWREHFTPGGHIPLAGSVARAPALARTLRAIATDGPEVFYRGAVAQRIAAFCAREGGLLTLEDLAAHTSEWVTPLSVPFAGLEVYQLPPNTQGVTALQMLGMLDGLALGEGPLAPETTHAAVEAKKLAFADRAAYLTDPAYMRVRPADLLAPDYLRQRRQRIDPHRAQPSVAPGSFAGDTIYLCAADGEGNVVSLIQSNYRGFGSGYVVEDTGISLHNRGAYFSLDPEAANALVPGKRTLHTLIPSLATWDGRPALAFGAMGGDGQPQTHLQVYTALARFGLNIQAAIELPRWIHGAEEPGEPEILRVEGRFPTETVAALRALGHEVEEIGAWDALMGYAQGIVIDQERGVLHGGADPRAESAAVGW
ncbi:MAG: gamma-glutamyltransferase [Ktedonobacterales bacterium]|nr:gamma-glutamyltransferase [Ktedonobacterales bacterium]